MIGDGTYWMTDGELLTAFQERLDVTVVVCSRAHGYESIPRSAAGEVGAASALSSNTVAVPARGKVSGDTVSRRQSRRMHVQWAAGGVHGR